MTILAVAVAGAAIVIGGGILTVGLARRRVVLVTVRGQSMAPTYRDGERLIALRRSRFSAGDVVIFRTPASHFADVDLLVKRAAATAGEGVPADLQARVGLAVVPAGRLLVRSDATEGLDSRHFGLISAADVLGVVRGARYLPHSAANRRISSENS
jgi:signal peptidase I